MVTRIHSRWKKRSARAFALMEMIAAIGILIAVVIPLAFQFGEERLLCRAYYNRAIAMEIIDGEMEILAAGEWKSFAEGRQPYSVGAGSAKNLPKGQFILTRTKQRLRLEWSALSPGHGGSVTRELDIP